MSVNLTGDSSIITTPLVATVTSLANNGSGAIRVTTSAPHFFGQDPGRAGDTVQIVTGVVVGSFAITVIDATHFDLIGSTFTSTSTGIATDQALTPSAQCPTDGDTFSAQLSGLLSSQQLILSRTQYLQKQAIRNLSTNRTNATTVALDNWQPAVSSTSIVGSSILEVPSFCWDIVAKSWNTQAFVGGGPTGTFVMSLNNGRTWTTRLGTGVNTAMAVMASHNGLLVGWTVGDIAVTSVTAGGTVSRVGFDSNPRTTGVAWWSIVDSLFYMYLVNESSGTLSNGIVVTTPTGTSSFVTHTPPSGWVSGSNHTGAFQVAQSPQVALVAMQGATAGTDTARLLQVATGGATTDITPSQATGKIILGVEYDATNGLWILLMYNGTDSTVYMSADTGAGPGAAWALVSTLPGQKAGQGVRAVNGVWAIVLSTPNLALPAAAFLVWLSADQGATWHTSFADTFPPGSANALQSSGTSLLMAQSGTVQTSLAVGLP